MCPLSLDGTKMNLSQCSKLNKKRTERLSVLPALLSLSLGFSFFFYVLDITENQFLLFVPFMLWMSYFFQVSPLLLFDI